MIIPEYITKNFEEISDAELDSLLEKMTIYYVSKTIILWGFCKSNVLHLGNKVIMWNCFLIVSDNSSETLGQKIFLLPKHP